MAALKKARDHANTLIILFCVFPSAMDVNDELGVTGTVSCGTGNVVGDPGEETEENLTMSRGELAGVLNDCVQRTIADLGEIVRFPVVPRAGCKQWIKRLLPLGVGHSPDMLFDGISNPRRG